MSRDSKDAVKSKKILDECLKQLDNKTCCECGSKQPRWSSTNLGCFMCIRCSGMHRNLGVHISKVKSVSLDTWPLEQADFMATMGNEKHNAVWEYAMPANRKPNEDDTNYVVEQFIKDKYEKKMFCKPEKAAKKGKKKSAAKEEKKAPAKVVKKKKQESSSESSSDDSDSDSEAESSEDERIKKKKAAVAKKKAAAVKAKPKSESDDSSSDSEDERAKAKKSKPTKKDKSSKKVKSPTAAAGFTAAFAATSISPPPSNGRAAAPAGDFGSFDADFGSSGNSGFDAPTTNGTDGGDDFFSSSAAEDPFNTAPSKKVPSAAATKSIMDKFGAAQSMMNPMMGGFGAQGMPAHAVPNMYANPQQQQYGASPYMMQQQQQPQFNPYSPQQPPSYQQAAYSQYGQQQQQQQQPQQGMYGAQMGQMSGYGQQATSPMQQQGNQFGGFGGQMAQQQQGNPFGMGQQSGGGPLDNLGMSQPVATPAPQQPAKADPFGEFGGLSGLGHSAPVRQQQSQTAAPAATSGGFFF